MVLVVGWIMLFMGCVTTVDPEKRPEINKETSFEETMELGIRYGGDTLQSAKKHIREKKWDKNASLWMMAWIEKNREDAPDIQLISAAHIVSQGPISLPLDWLQKLLEDERKIVKQIGWQLAASKPSDSFHPLFERVLSNALKSNQLTEELLPQMAQALRVNRWAPGYTIIRRGLMEDGSEEFAQAMMALNPSRASDDFLPYLAKASSEELRQLNTVSVQVFTVLSILTFMKKEPPSLGHQNSRVLFSYAVSRNTAIAELAQSVLERYVPSQTQILAAMLAGEPVWVQMAFIEQNRRNSRSPLNAVLSELKELTPDKDVAGEIDSIRF